MVTTGLDARASQGAGGFAPFWCLLAEYDDLPAILEPRTGRSWTYRELSADVEEGAERLADVQKRLVAIVAGNTADDILAYLSALRAGHAVLVCDRHLSDHGISAMIEAYAPDLVLGTGAEPAGWHSGYVSVPSLQGLARSERRERSDVVPHGELSIVLPTSGSTGSPKAARLSWRNVAANASQIRLSLGLEPRDRSITLLPVSYVFGLSVVHSHLSAGASLVVDERSIFDRGFWALVEGCAVTSLAGVPFTYDVFRKMRLEQMDLPSLRTLIQSGGKLSAPTLSWLRQAFSPEVEIFLMYGMTEGAGRLCVLPPGMLNEKPDSVGPAVPFGEITCSPDSEIVFTGPNIMLGYAQGRTDLAREDDCGGVLHTGDIGFQDPDGCVYITGRKSRFCKFLGRRYSLDDIERFFDGCGQVVAVADDSGVALFHSGDDAAALQRRLEMLAAQFGLPLRALRLTRLNTMPRTASGKVAYHALTTRNEGKARMDGKGYFG